MLEGVSLYIFGRRGRLHLVVVRFKGVWHELKLIGW